jgi:biopolymer transport protein ExbB
MTGLQALWSGSDGVGRGVMLVLLAMSVVSWVLILWKGWLLRRVQRDLALAVPAYWAASDANQGRERLQALDRQRLLLPLLQAVQLPPVAGTLEAGAPAAAQATRRLRDALQAAVAQLQYGQVVLASVGSTAPFIGLLGTVWGVFQALVGIGAAGEGGFALERVAGPIGEALVMTAAGIAVAVPAVLGYNVCGQKVAACEAELEGFAHDLLLAAHPAVPSAGAR